MSSRSLWAFVAALAAGMMLLVHVVLAAETIRQGFAGLTALIAGALLSLVVALLVQQGE